MDCMKTGKLIKDLRTQMGYTQKQLADIMNISDKTVSKWERGLGLPDVSLLSELSSALGVDIEKMLEGELTENTFVSGNMKKSKYYVCPVCSNIVVSTGNARISCCGRALKEIVPQKAPDGEKLCCEIIEDDWFISSSHPMTKDHYISFLCFVTGESLNVIKLYPEWNLQKRIPKHAHGMLLWYCTEHGLFYQYI